MALTPVLTPVRVEPRLHTLLRWAGRTAAGWPTRWRLSAWARRVCPASALYRAGLKGVNFYRFRFLVLPLWDGSYACGDRRNNYSNEKSDYRFETFTREICEKHEGIDFVPTSQSWDRWRDARSTAAGKGSHRNIICATLNKDVNAKVEADLLRVTATSMKRKGILN